MKNITLILIISLLALCACNTTRYAQRNLRKIRVDHPELFKADTTYSEQSDTIMLAIGESRIDTLILAQDTIVIENERIKIKIVERKVDNFIEVEAICKPDTVQTISVNTTATIKEDMAVETVYVTRIPVWLKLVVAMFVGLYFKLLLLK